MKKQYLKLLDQTLDFLKDQKSSSIIASTSIPFKTIQMKKVKPQAIPPSPSLPKVFENKPKIEVKDPVEEKPQVKQESSSFKLERPSVPKEQSLETFRTFLKEIDPELFLHDKIPSDQKAKKIKEAWKIKELTPDIPILAHGKQYHLFLSNIAKAIELNFAPSHVIDIENFEKGKKWDVFLSSPQIKLVIAPDYAIWGAKELLPFYKENPQQGTRHIGKVPLLLLPDLSLYYKDPYLKRSLWNVICQMLKQI